ncbi:capsular polysaccharide export protein [Rhodovulum imhoffii]|uniref:Capsular polysaccharide export protein n=1 Tax=Rhodovulum imhoffii TaxID=365340 RepID=A0A2T5BSG6_9RHOB|nr:capsular biosynthesis protein [Rhodovulum imhoffii]MBK5933487.1 capsular biosynthesis protein [Rhodovulum imhoffii]PTN02276.1 capsular polysaccharide export protein [Rhodovulum imhoffii]
MIAWLAGWTKRKDALFTALAAAAGGGVRLPAIGLSLRGFSESGARARAALAVAKRQPHGRAGRWLKLQLIRAQYNWSRHYFTRHPERVAACWNGLTGSRRAFMEGARDAGAARLYLELAPFPGRVTLDHTGVNARNSLPRDPAFYRGWANTPERRGEGWRALGKNLTARASRRTDVGQAGADALHGAGPFLFCPLQVPNDSQITLFSGWVGSVAGMLEALAGASDALPEGWHLRVKEHPSAKTSLAGALGRAVARANGRIVVDNATDTFAQVAASGGVITINSSVGLQAFFHDKPVLVLGQAFFAIPGLTTPVSGPDALRTALSAPADAGFDPALRAAFMNYLDQVYYLRVVDTPAGLRLDGNAIAQKLAAARAAV